MKKFFTIIASICFIWFCFNGLQAQTAQVQSNQIVIGKTETIFSKILNEERTIRISVPGSATSEIYTKQRYPVVYLLDGDAVHFSSVLGMIRRLGSNYLCPEMIVVGIPNTDRTRDLTPSHMKSWHFLNAVLDSNFCKTSGGGEKFISFLEEELMPHIDSLYPTAPYRILIGHSFGGLTVMNTLIKHTNLFKSYIAIDPAMSWDNQKLLNEAKKALANNNYSGITLYLGIANTMDAGMDTTKVIKDVTKATEHIRSIFELRSYLSNNKGNHLKYTSRYYNDYEHNSVVLIAEYDALRYIFNYYHLSLFYRDYRNIENLYENVSKHFGYEVKPPEGMVNYIGNSLLGLGYFEDALFLLKLNVSNYPESYNVYNSMGDFYSAKGDKVSAIDNYKKALSIKEVVAVRQKLDKLQGN